MKTLRKIKVNDLVFWIEGEASQSNEKKSYAIEVIAFSLPVILAFIQYV